MSRPRRSWEWRDWAHAAADVASGEVHEHQQLELKRENYGNGDSAKKELAKDVAALAVDGGTLVIGVEEDKPTGRAAALTPVELAGQVERIRQVCTARIDPPLGITVTDLPNPEDPTTGLIIIDVPPSPFAPHQVDGRYLGRADRTVRVLSDAEVFRLYRLREVSADAALQDLDRAWRKGQDRGLGSSTLAVAVTPSVVLQPELLRDQLAGGQSWLNEVIRSAEANVRAIPNDSALGQLVWADAHLPFVSRSGGPVPDGFAFTYSHGDDVASYLEASESGAVVLVSRDLVTDVPGYPDYGKVLDQFKAITFTAIALAVFVELAQRSGLRTTVNVGVLLDGLKGAKRQRQHSRPGWDERIAYPDGRYQRTTAATSAELAENLTPAMDRLYGPLTRALGMGDPLRQPRAER
ncbi:helix-turn-helix domain-containing protein [Micromonospora fulviviridis]|uniref:helix-turn-helix domain-containing protein n=1 Tax=Micromonospora fulviviridis TaxID=47860 RepID=UPI0037A27550